MKPKKSTLLALGVALVVCLAVALQFMLAVDRAAVKKQPLQGQRVSDMGDSGPDSASESSVTERQDAGETPVKSGSDAPVDAGSQGLGSDRPATDQSAVERAMASYESQPCYLTAGVVVSECIRMILEGQNRVLYESPQLVGEDERSTMHSTEGQMQFYHFSVDEFPLYASVNESPELHSISATPAPLPQYIDSELRVLVRRALEFDD